jgi:diguanylate cyclase (GGDEF)-like protein
MDNILDSLEDDEFDLEDLIVSHNTPRVSHKDKDLEDYEDSLNGFELSNDQDSSDTELDLSKDVKLKVDNSETEISLEKFSAYVLQEIEAKGLPATPDNYEIYFLQLLEFQNESFQKKIFQLLDKEKIGHTIEDKKNFEESIQKSLQLTEQLLNVTTKAHTNLGIMKNIVSKREQELGSRRTRDIIKLLKFDLNKLDGILSKQSDSMKNLYGRNVDVVNSIHEKTIFDRKYQTYNRKYFIDSLRNEIQKVEYFKHQTSILLLIPHKSLTSQNLSPKIAFIISKTIATILMQNSRRSDVVAYYGNNIFGVMLTHSDIAKSRDKLQKFITSFKESSLFIAGKEIEIKVKMGLTLLNSQKRVEDSLLSALEALKKANRDEEAIFEIGE